MQSMEHPYGPGPWTTPVDHPSFCKCHTFYKQKREKWSSHIPLLDCHLGPLWRKDCLFLEIFSLAKRYSPMQPITFISPSLWSSTTLSSISSWMWIWSVPFLMPSSFTTLLIASLFWLSNLFGGLLRPARILTDFSMHLRMVSVCDLILPFVDIIHTENAGESSFCMFSHSLSISPSSTSTNPLTLFPWSLHPGFFWLCNVVFL